MSAAEYQNAGRLAASGHRALALRVEPLRVSIGKPTNDPMARTAHSWGMPAATPAALRLAPPGDRKPRCGMRTQLDNRTAINSVGSGLRPVAHKARSPRGVSSLPVVLTLLPRESPMPLQNCSRGSALRNGLSRHKAIRVVAALPTHFLLHDPLLRSAPRLHFFHGMGDSRGSRLK